MGQRKCYCILAYMVNWFLTRVPRPFNGERGRSHPYVELGQLDICRPQTKIYIKRIKDPNRRANTVKRLEENTGENLPDTGFGKDFFFFFFLLFFFFGRTGTACGILVSCPGMEPRPSAGRAQSPNHWAIREFPGNDFLNMTPKAQATKEKTGKLDSVKIKNYCASKDTLRRLKRQPTHWKKVPAKHVSAKGFTSRIQLNKNKTT